VITIIYRRQSPSSDRLAWQQRLQRLARCDHDSSGRAGGGTEECDGTAGVVLIPVRPCPPVRHHGVVAHWRWSTRAPAKTRSQCRRWHKCGAPDRFTNSQQLHSVQAAAARRGTRAHGKMCAQDGQALTTAKAHNCTVHAVSTVPDPLEQV